MLSNNVEHIIYNITEYIEKLPYVEQGLKGDMNIKILICFGIMRHLP